MILPVPEQGLVVHYGYLWQREHRRGSEGSRRSRPCVIMIVQEGAVRASPKVTLAPITHSEPRAGDDVVEVPLGVRRHLGLDQERSWVVGDEVNQFAWPGFDLEPPPGTSGRTNYGFVPPLFFDEIRRALLNAYDARRLKSTGRD